jgi:putative DNA-invertase from lambdoid prophage Rac
VLGTKADQKKRGRFLGGTAPFGWEVGEDGALIDVPEQQATIRQIVELRRQGLSLRAIAARIGGTVSHVTVRNILANADAQNGSKGELAIT